MSFHSGGLDRRTIIRVYEGLFVLEQNYLRVSAAARKADVIPPPAYFSRLERSLKGAL
jgi:hypothetical protein